MIEREKKRIKLFKKYQRKRNLLLQKYNTTTDYNLKLELQFKVQSRSNKYIAEFVSSKLKKTEEEKVLYIQEIIKADMEEAGQEDTILLTFGSETEGM